jgi:hypothetical protein
MTILFLRNIFMYWTNFSNNPSVNEIMEELLKGLASEIRDRVFEDTFDTDEEFKHLQYEAACNLLIERLVHIAFNDDIEDGA